MKKNILTCIIYTIIQWTYGIIQNILGLMLFIFYLIKNPKSKIFYYHGAIVITRNRKLGSMGLGMFIFFGHNESDDKDKVLVHEWGHTVQSIILGPLYLLVIGLPSITWAFIPKFVKLRKEKGVKYTDLYCEKWASGMGEKLTGSPAIWV